MPHHFTHGFNRNFIIKCYCCSERVSNAAEGKLLKNAADNGNFFQITIHALIGYIRENPALMYGLGLFL